MAVTITQDDIKNAKSYMPLAHKAAISNLMAALCVNAVENNASTADNPLPPVRVENRMMRQQCLMGVLAGWYLGKEYECQELEVIDKDGKSAVHPINYCMSVAALDEFCESHPKNQLERLKKEKAVANKVYDIMEDFKQFEIFLSAAIRETIEMQNDPAVRLSLMLAMQSSPEEMRKTLETISEYRSELEAKENG